MEKLISHSRIINIYELLNMIDNHGLRFRKELIKQSNQNTPKLRSKVIENIMLGLPIPQIVIDQDGYLVPTIISGNFLVKSIADFKDNKFKLYTKYNLDVDQLYFDDFNFYQKRNFLESQVMIIEYIGKIDPLIKCSLYRETNKYIDNILNLNQMVREICFPRGSVILSDFTNILQSRTPIYTNRNKQLNNNLTLSYLLLFFHIKNNYSFLDRNRAEINGLEVTYLKDNLLKYLDLNLDDQGFFLFRNENDILNYIENEYIIDFLGFLNMNRVTPFIKEDIDFFSWINHMNRQGLNLNAYHRYHERYL